MLISLPILFLTDSITGSKEKRTPHHVQVSVYPGVFSGEGHYI